MIRKQISKLTVAFPISSCVDVESACVNLVGILKSVCHFWDKDHLMNKILFGKYRAYLRLRKKITFSSELHVLHVGRGHALSSLIRR